MMQTPISLRCFRLKGLYVVQASTAGEGQRTNGEERRAAAMGSEESFHRAHGHGTMFSAKRAGVRAMPEAHLYAPPVMAVQQTTTDYSDV